MNCNVKLAVEQCRILLSSDKLFFRARYSQTTQIDASLRDSVSCVCVCVCVIMLPL